MIRPSMSFVTTCGGTYIPDPRMTVVRFLPGGRRVFHAADLSEVRILSDLPSLPRPAGRRISYECHIEVETMKRPNLAPPLPRTPSGPRPRAGQAARGRHRVQEQVSGYSWGWYHAGEAAQDMLVTELVKGGSTASSSASG